MENFHTHTYRCNHAKGEDRDYVNQAIAEGFSLLGFSDHCPWPFDYTGRKRLRMAPQELGEYADSVRSLRDEFKGRIDIRLGLEVDAFVLQFGWLGELVQKHGIEYLILGNHYTTTDEVGFLGNSCTPKQMLIYVESTRKSFESELSFMYMAHPDLIFCNYPVFDENCIKASHDICALAKEHHMPVEFNISGEIKKAAGRVKGLGYPTPEFWDIAYDYDLDVYVGIDAHEPWHISAKRYSAAVDYLKTKGFRVLNA